jgi:hypothetical protein
MNFSKKIVIAVLVMNVLFTTAVLVVSWHTLQPLDALVMGWFAFTTGELWTLGKIERDKQGRIDVNDSEINQ